MQIINTAHIVSSDPSIVGPIEVHVHDDGRAVACYDGHPDVEYSTLSELEAAHQIEIRAARSAEAWWAWHDQDASRHSPGEDADEATAEAERRCAAWVAGESDDGPGTPAKGISFEVVAGTASETTTGVEGGIDVDFTLTINGIEHDGEVTLLPHEDGRPGYGSWGAPDNWVDSRTLRAIRDLDRDTYSDILDAILAETAPEATSFAAGQ